MAGSRTSPVLRDQWSADPDRDPRDRERRRGRGSGRDRGRNRGRDRGRPYRPNNRNLDRPGRSPPHASRFGPDSSHDLGDFAPDRSPLRGSPPPRNFHNNRRLDLTKPVSSTGDWNTHTPGPFDREALGLRKDESSAGPPQKRQRTRSPSPRGGRGPLPPPRLNYSDNWDIRDRSPSFKKRGGRNQGRGAPRRRSPRRGRDRRGKDRPRPDIPRPGRSRSPVHERGFHPSPDQRSRTPGDDNYSDHGSHYRSNSRHSVRSATSRNSASSRRSRRDSAMNINRPIQSVVDDAARSPSSPRPIPIFDSDNFAPPGEHSTHARDELPTHAMRSDMNNQPRRRPSRPHLKNRPYGNAQYATSTGSYHGSPQPPSPYSGGRGGWTGPPPYSGTGHTSPCRHDDYSSQNGNYFHAQGQFSGLNNHHPQSHFGGPPHRGGHSGSGHRGNLSNQGPDRRFSGSGPHPYHAGPSQRGARGHFNNLQWTASGSRGRGGQHSPHQTHSHGSQTPNRPQSHNDPQSPRAGESDHYARPSSRDEGVNQAQAQPDGGNPQSMPPPTHESNETTPANKGGNSALLSKDATGPRAGPSCTRATPTTSQSVYQWALPKFKPDLRLIAVTGPWTKCDRDRRDFRSRENSGERLPDKPSDWQDRRRGPSPQPPREALPPKQKRVLTRLKPRPTLPEEFANAESVYYRKPGNESVIGAGTYGKVFKGIHVYTQRKVALKKIRMEGEKDGFPVTAVREIKLLQHLRNHNVVSLLEVMVEKNECFMVFEYLSHDLTGLINHPTFSLTLPHKKDLAKQMFEGLNYLHHRGVLHRDIKAANILISNRGLLKFADFGLARFFSKSRQLDYTNRVITIWYRPPELLLGETRYGPAVDVWSAACVCMEMFTKKAVFPGEGGELSQMDKIYNALGTPTKTEWPDLVEMPWFHLMRPTERRKRVFEDVYRDVLTTGAMDLISSIFRYDPSQRPSAEDVLKHPYFVSEEPAPHPPIELEHVEGDWHEFESKALRKEARRVEYQNQKDRDKRKADASVPRSDRDFKRTKQDSSDRVSAQ
ncbi:hypothetical protein PDIDSM_2855 [Penicillium digitatum]|nr:hypothetical protein PDIDSM_2855 [Penicillium digitatum]